MQPDPQAAAPEPDLVTDERLAELDDLPVDEHLPIYEAVHRDLTAALADSAEGSADEPVGDADS